MGDQRGTRVYVGNLTDKIKKDDLEGEFTKYGKLNSVWIAFNPPGFAFVEFEHRDDAEKACDVLNGSELLGSQLRVEISKGRPRQRRGGGRGSYGGRDGRDGRRSSSGGGSSSFRPRGSSGSGGGSRGSRYHDRGYGGSSSSYGSGRDGFSRRDSYGRDGGRSFGSSSGSGGYGRSGGRSGSNQDGGRFRSRSPAGGSHRF